MKNDRRISQLNILMIIVAGVSLCFIALFLFVFSPEHNRAISTDELVSYNEGWILKNYRGKEDIIIDLPTRVDASGSEVITIMNKVPENMGDNFALFFKTDFQNVVVMLNDSKVYSNGVLNDQKLVKSAVPCYNVVELKNSKPGDIITIYLVSGYDKYSGELGTIECGSKGDIISHIFRENGMGFVVSLSLLVITLLLLISVIIMKNIHVNKLKAIYAFCFVMIASLWSILQNPIMELITGNHFAVYMSGMVLLLVMPIVYVMYQRCFAIKRRYAQIFEIGIYLFGINFLTGVVFQMLNVCDFATYMTVTKIAIVAGLIILSFIMYIAADTFSDKSIKSNFIGNVIITTAALLEAALSLFDFYMPYDGVVLQTGIYLFLILMVVTVEKNIISQMHQEQKNALEEASIEKDRAIKHINSNLIYSALNVAVNDLKENDRKNSRLIYDSALYLKHNVAAVTEEGMVPFTKELEYIKAYLGMQRRRHEELETIVEDKITDFKVPYNTIEPLVENATVNGALRSQNSGRIVVRSYERLDCFAIQIVDNGIGIGPDRKFSGKQSFKTIKKRLKNSCGAAVEINNKQGKGTILTVKVPKEGYIIKE